MRIADVRTIRARNRSVVMTEVVMLALSVDAKVCKKTSVVEWQMSWRLLR
jgi:hypothetical protein